MSLAEELKTITRKVYGKKQRMGTMGVLTRKNAAGEVEVLMLERRLKTPEKPEYGPPGGWAFPGGGVDEDEIPEEAIVREYKEEVGLDVRVIIVGYDTVWAQTNDFLENDFWRCFFFRVELVTEGQEPRLMEPGKHLRIEWVPYTKVCTRTVENKPDWKSFQSLENLFETRLDLWKPESLFKRL
ncbi:NUDIX hydrolase domain-like protein [Astrocystis sublimbata]|nr:NUDIX hydrolase domain-like protein [Astrocystis sublimbata]KAI0198338.1 NUDIX hydrolase domain-like protein [Astrocystis sublimbata]